MMFIARASAWYPCANIKKLCYSSESFLDVEKPVAKLWKRKCVRKTVLSKRMRLMIFLFICGDGPEVFLDGRCFFLREFQVPAVFPSPCSQPVNAGPLPLPPSYSEPLIAWRWGWLTGLCAYVCVWESRRELCVFWIWGKECSDMYFSTNESACVSQCLGCWVWRM